MKNRKKPGNEAETVASINLQEIERLLAFMSEHGLEEFEYERAGLRVRLKRPMADSRPVAAAALPLAARQTTASPAPAPEGGAAATSPAAEAPAEEELHVIKSPIVGTYYEAANPGADPFVRVGSRVEAGQVLCIIEAMKLMNEIESDVAGEVVHIHVENGQPVEYGEALFSIRAAGKKK